jgi:hypothetical protein
LTTNGPWHGSLGDAVDGSEVSPLAAQAGVDGSEPPVTRCVEVAGEKMRRHRGSV